MKRRKAVLGVLAAASLAVPILGTGAGALPRVIDPEAVISNGTISLGVFPEGHLNATGVGVLFEETAQDGTIAGCACEGWGAGDSIGAVSGFANASSGISDVETESFVTTADTAVSVSLIPDAVTPVLRVTHDYHPSPDTPNLYEVEVTIENASAATVTPVYERVMDWDIPPTEFDEFVTIQGTAAADNVTFASDDGFHSGDPLSPESWINFVGDAVDNLDEVLTPDGDGPDTDHGAQIRFEFDDLDPGDSTSFRTFYGAAATEAEADLALASVGAEVYSYGQSNTPDGPTLGTPSTFIFAFAGIGGTTAFPFVQLASEAYEVQEDEGPATIEVELSAASSSPVTVDFTTSAGTATPGDDYTETSGTLTIDAGDTTGTFTIPVVDDGDDEEDETVTITLTDPVNAFLGTPEEGTLTITDPPPPTTTTTSPPARPAIPVPGDPNFTG